jgi:hypothetical protein
MRREREREREREERRIRPLLIYTSILASHHKLPITSYLDNEVIVLTATIPSAVRSSSRRLRRWGNK